jgi:hypothetical protein
MSKRLLNKITGIVHDVPDDHWAVNDPDYEVVGVKAPTLQPDSILVTDPDVDPEPVWMQELPADFPHRDKLIADGYREIATVRLATDEELMAVAGKLTRASVRKIRKWLDEN